MSSEVAYTATPRVGALQSLRIETDAPNVQRRRPRSERDCLLVLDGTLKRRPRFEPVVGIGAASFHIGARFIVSADDRKSHDLKGGEGRGELTSQDS
eukprot:6197464-Pleurochrysis_carterae.AAC.4